MQAANVTEPVIWSGEDEGGAGYLGDAAGAGGHVLEGGPALGKQGEPAFAAAATDPRLGGPVAERQRSAG